MKAYQGIIEGGVVVLRGVRLPEGTTVTVTVSDGELWRARITNIIRDSSGKVKAKLRPPLQPETALKLLRKGCSDG